MKPFRIQGFPLTAVVVGLLTLILLLLVSATRWFLLGSIVFGVLVAFFLWRSRTKYPVGLAEDPRRPDIDMHRIPVGGGAAGLIFAIGCCLIFLIGIPALRWFLLGAVAFGAAVGGLLWRWHKNRPVEITDIHDANR